MICSNCGYNNADAPSDTTPCAFCGYRKSKSETPLDPEAAAVILPVIATPATVAISEAVEAPAPLSEPISL